ncbi:MAG: DUF2442 domain-containing protein [Alistipes sp.]|jgi:hypothetical protein|nr:DUF2442 domain-containing protein [Alistipes sp.]
MELIWVTDATYAGGYKIALTFSDGLRKTVDLADYQFTGVFESLKNVENFKKFKLSDWTVEWNDGIDIAPEALYSM